MVPLCGPTADDSTGRLVKDDPCTAVVPDRSPLIPPLPAIVHSKLEEPAAATTGVVWLTRNGACGLGPRTTRSNSAETEPMAGRANSTMTGT